MKKIIQRTEVPQGATNSKFAIKIVRKEINQCNPHWHDHYEIIFIKSNKLKISTTNTIIPLKKYSIVLFPPYTVHDTISDEDFAEVVVLSLSSAFYQQILNNAENSILSFLDNISLSLSPTICDAPNSRDFERIFINIEKEYKNYTHASDAIVHGNLLVLFGLLYKNETPISPDTTLTNDQGFNRVKVKEYITENFHCKLTLSDVATHFNYSPTYFSKIFKKSLGISFNNYLNSLKIKKAQELLFLKNKNTTEVANLLNYDSPQNFCRIYKQKTGFSPYQHKNSYTLNIAPFFKNK
ncbi:MAG: AraC family transcriptional regulator [Clostridia bacterium]|nr:AraC family transcriptional regulator [Clostridia bacterium]